MAITGIQAILISVFVLVLVTVALLKIYRWGGIRAAFELILSLIPF